MNKCRFCEKSIRGDYVICSGSSCLRKRLDISNIKDQISIARCKIDEAEEWVIRIIALSPSVSLDSEQLILDCKWSIEEIITDLEAELKKLEEE